jgi:protein-S-isoprenylcysteine O-methyltransferase Ste14
MSKRALPSAPMRRPPRAELASALALGVAGHASFAAAVGAMVLGLHQGLSGGAGRLTGALAWAANAGLALSFPLLHSWLLTRGGGRALDRVSPRRGRELRTTTYALSASLHVLAVFTLWSPVGRVLWRAQGAASVASNLAFAASWLLLGKAMRDAGLAVQTGWLGWSSVVRGRRLEYPPFATRGLFRFTRQPVYVAFAATLWTAPLLTTDALLLASVWTLYCLVGPLLKERRMLRREPARYGRYRQLVPYWLPRPAPRRLEI